jgi:protein farnesyltransferase subunit beta
MMQKIPEGYHKLNSGLPWFAYWTLNIFDMLNRGEIEMTYEIKLEFVKYLKDLHHENGGFSGYGRSMPNLISSYAAILAICILDIPEAYDIIDIPKMREFILKNKNNDLKNQDSILDIRGDFLLKKEIDGKTF